MVQRAIVNGIINRDLSVMGKFEYDYELILGIKRYAVKSDFKSRIEYLDLRVQAKEHLNLEIELRKEVIAHFTNKI